MFSLDVSWMYFFLIFMLLLGHRCFFQLSMLGWNSCASYEIAVLGCDISTPAQHLRFSSTSPLLNTSTSSRHRYFSLISLLLLNILASPQHLYFSSNFRASLPPVILRVRDVPGEYIWLLSLSPYLRGSDANGCTVHGRSSVPLWRSFLCLLNPVFSSLLFRAEYLVLGRWFETSPRRICLLAILRTIYDGWEDPRGRTMSRNGEKRVRWIGWEVLACSGLCAVVGIRFQPSSLGWLACLPLAASETWRLEVARLHGAWDGMTLGSSTGERMTGRDSLIFALPVAASLYILRLFIASPTRVWMLSFAAVHRVCIRLSFRSSSHEAKENGIRLIKGPEGAAPNVLALDLGLREDRFFFRRIHPGRPFYTSAIWTALIRGSDNKEFPQYRRPREIRDSTRSDHSPPLYPGCTLTRTASWLP